MYTLLPSCSESLFQICTITLCIPKLIALSNVNVPDRILAMGSMKNNKSTIVTFEVCLKWKLPKLVQWILALCMLTARLKEVSCRLLMLCTWNDIKNFNLGVI